MKRHTIDIFLTKSVHIQDHAPGNHPLLRTGDFDGQSRDSGLHAAKDLAGP